MKLFITLSLSILMIGCGSFLPSFGNTSASIKIGVPTVQCGMCQETIQETLESMDGVQKAHVNLNEEKVLVKFDPEKQDLSALRSAIAAVGYQADDVPADESVYQDLPGCCKLPQDQ